MTTPASTTSAAPTTFAEAESVLAANLPGYESRPQQQRLAAAVEILVASETPVTGLFQAGCGTGKSLGLMIPAILSGKKTLVATATKALMEQYANSDVPFLEANLGVEFTWAMLKGRSNYFCFSKASQADRSKYSWIEQAWAEAEPVDHDGDFEHFETVTIPADETWVAATSSADCPGARDCPFGQACKAQAAKARAKTADLVVTNTAMLMADLVVRAKTEGDVEMLGEYEVVIIDEAHELEEWATSALSEEIKRRGIETLLIKASALAGAQGANIAEAVTEVTNQMDLAWMTLDAEIGTSRSKDAIRLPRSWFLDHGIVWADFGQSLRDLAIAIGGIAIRNGDAKRGQASQSMLVRQAMNASAKVDGALYAEDGETVRWIETQTRTFRGKTETVTTLSTAPVHVGSFLREWLWTKVPAALASATLSVGSDFSYIQGRLGITDPHTFDVGTPFDYTTQARLFIPAEDVPNPKDRPGWMTYAMRTTIGLIDAAGGGALLLFTSRSAMQQSYDSLASEIESRGHTVLMQGLSGTNKEIARIFSEDKTSVLFALKSFFTGVDFRGDTCRLVVIDKLPFPVPSEPVFAARADAIKKVGGNDFSTLSIPAMSLVLIQGFGRLIRSRTDIGVVAILDSRLRSTGWGKGINKSLPNSPRISTVAEAASFYEEA
jgi:ATP-dependent DNA helicase DinG